MVVRTKALAMCHATQTSSDIHLLVDGACKESRDGVSDIVRFGPAYKRVMLRCREIIHGADRVTLYRGLLDQGGVRLHVRIVSRFAEPCLVFCPKMFVRVCTASKGFAIEEYLVFLVARTSLPNEVFGSVEEDAVAGDVVQPEQSCLELLVSGIATLGHDDFADEVDHAADYRDEVIGAREQVVCRCCFCKMSETVKLVHITQVGETIRQAQDCVVRVDVSAKTVNVWPRKKMVWSLVSLVLPILMLSCYYGSYSLIHELPELRVIVFDQMIATGFKHLVHIRVPKRMGSLFRRLCCPGQCVKATSGT